MIVLCHAGPWSDRYLKCVCRIDPAARCVIASAHKKIDETGDLPKGTVLKAERLDYKRPGTGIAPGMNDFVIGRTLKKDLKFDDILTIGDLV